MSLNQLNLHLHTEIINSHVYIQQVRCHSVHSKEYQTFLAISMVGDVKLISAGVSYGCLTVEI